MIEREAMLAIARHRTEARWSDVVVHNGIVYVAGQVGTAGRPVAEQTREALALIDELLAAAGTDKTQLLQATIWLQDIRDQAAMDTVWQAWVPPGQAPARACGGVALGDPGWLVEIIVTAALP